MIAELNELEQRLRQLAARISVIAEAPGVSFIPSGRHVHDSKEPTTGAGWTLSDEFAARLSSAKNSPRRLRELEEWCERQVKARTHTPPKPVRKLKARVLEDYAGLSCRQVGEIEGIPAMSVWRWRRDADLDETGNTANSSRSSATSTGIL